VKNKAARMLKEANATVLPMAPENRWRFLSGMADPTGNGQPS